MWPSIDSLYWYSVCRVTMLVHAKYNPMYSSHLIHADAGRKGGKSHIWQMEKRRWEICPHSTSSSPGNRDCVCRYQSHSQSSRVGSTSPPHLSHFLAEPLQSQSDKWPRKHFAGREYNVGIMNRASPKHIQSDHVPEVCATLTPAAGPRTQTNHFPG